MSKAQVGSRVRIRCSARGGGEPLAAVATEREVLEFRVGAGRFARFLEDAVLDMSPGEIKTASFAPEQAFGAHRADLVFEVPRTRMPHPMAASVGEEVDIHHPRGGTMPARVAAVGPATITLDANHPLAGKRLTLDIELLSVE